MSAGSIFGCRRASEAAAAALLAVAVAGPAIGQAPTGAATGNQASAGAPGSAIVTLDQEALFLDSAFGQRVQRELERDRAALAAENRRIEGELIEEERELTAKRDNLPPAEFEALATAFDDKVQRIRETQDTKARRLQQQLERERERFLSVVGPVMTDIMRERGAAVLIDSQAVLISVPGIDITEEAVTAIDARLGDGSDEGLAVPTARPEKSRDGPPDEE